MHVNNGLIFFNDCVIVPEKLRPKVLGLLHESHQGVNRRRKRARKLFYWPGISREIADMIAKCKTCEKYKPRTTKEPLILHEMTNLPYQKLACDIQVLDFGSKSFLAMIDYYSKWLELI
ncbi:Integrase zinc binding domain [Popillia japonica]|uniref:RNA-directed DNA polymerase n=1 Tax=Popillia japonica TaxID=7064 RepID=A0AAW1KRT2_POPJA